MVEFLNTLPYIGLSLDIVGAGLLWKYGITSTIDHPEFNAVMDEALVGGGPSYDQIIIDSKRQIKIVKKWSKLGLFLLMAGFFCQIVGSVSSSMTIKGLQKKNESLNFSSENSIAKLEVLISNQNKTTKRLNEQESLNDNRYELVLSKSEDDRNVIRKELAELQDVVNKK